jgi:TonB-dependent receptor
MFTTARHALLTAASVLALAPATALAQSAPQDTAAPNGQTPPGAAPKADSQSVGQIIITGTRASLQNAERVKLKADVIVDGISADDISALPDASIAESLVRVVGLSSNDNPRGPDAISIRGLGPDLTLTTVNGRILPSNAPGDRRISLAELPTEGIDGAFVLKTSSASALEGGVAGTLDLETIHPLDTSRHGLTLVARVNNQDNSEDLKDLRHYSPYGVRTEATYVDRFGSNLGVALSYSFLKQFTGFVGDQIDNWRLGTGPRADLNADGKPDALPTNVGVTSNFNDDTRHSLLGMVQWRPAESLKVSLDGMFISDTLFLGPTRFFANNIYNGTAVGPATSSTVNSYNNAEALTGPAALYREIQNDQRQLDRNYGGGLNVAYNSTHFLARFDVSLEEARRDLDSPQATIEDKGATAAAQRQVISYDISDPNHTMISFVPLDPNKYALSQYVDSVQHTRDVIKAGRGDFEYRPDASPILKSIAFGFKIDRQIHSTDQDNTQYSFASLAARPGLDSSYLQLVGNPFANAADYFGGPNAVNFPYFDIQKLSVLRTAPGVIVSDQFATDIARTYRVTENTGAVYGQLNLLAGRFSGNAGLRFVVTTGTVSGQSGTTTANLTDLKFRNTYRYLLPSANLKYQLTDALALRLAASKTFARQQWNDLQISSAVDLSTVPNGVLTITRGNPNLKPFTSRNLDASLEWSPDRSTFISIAAFVKYLNNFLIAANENTTVTLTNGTEVPAIISTVINDPETTNIRGIEVNLRKDLDFLPGFLRNLGLEVNYNRNATNIKETLVSLVGTTAPTTPDNATKQVINAQLYYSTKNLDLRLAYRHYDRYARAFFNAYQIQPAGQLDFSFGWTLKDKWRLIGAVTNLTKARMRRYDPDYRDLSDHTLTQLTVYQGRMINLGLRTTL